MVYREIGSEERHKTCVQQMGGHFMPCHAGATNTILVSYEEGLVSLESEDQYRKKHTSTDLNPIAQP